MSSRSDWLRPSSRWQEAQGDRCAAPPHTVEGWIRYRLVGILAAIGLGAACSSGTENSDGGALQLHVLPRDTTIPILGTAAYEVVATNATGDTVPAPAVVWTASDSGIAGIAQDGTATGRTAGVTTIKATASSGETGSTSLTVAGGAAQCYGIAAARKFTGSVQWGFKAVDQLGESGFRVTADDNGSVNADMTLTGPGPFISLWDGPLGGTSSASVTQRRSDNGSTLATYTSTSGSILPQPVLGLPKLSLLVDLQNCSYRVVTSASVATVLTDDLGHVTNSVDIIAQVQFVGAVPSDWRTNGIGRANGTMMANTIPYMGLHPDEDVLAPLGFAPDLFGSSPAAVQASGGFHLTFVE